MALALNDIRRLGRAAGENTTTGAFQRIEQAVANFSSRNDATTEEVEEFRQAAEEAFRETVNARFDGHIASITRIAPA